MAKAGPVTAWPHSDRTLLHPRSWRGAIRQGREPVHRKTQGGGLGQATSFSRRQNLLHTKLRPDQLIHATRANTVEVAQESSAHQQYLAEGNGVSPETSTQDSELHTHTHSPNLGKQATRGKAPAGTLHINRWESHTPNQLLSQLTLSERPQLITNGRRPNRKTCYHGQGASHARKHHIDRQMLHSVM